MDLCEVCLKEKIRYELRLAENIRCPYCNHLKYKKNKTELNLCSTQCKSLYWCPSEYLSKKKSRDVRIKYIV